MIHLDDLFWLDDLEPNNDARTLVQRKHMKEVFATVRTYSAKAFNNRKRVRCSAEMLGAESASFNARAV